MNYVRIKEVQKWWIFQWIKNRINKEKENGEIVDDWLSLNKSKSDLRHSTFKSWN